MSVRLNFWVMRGMLIDKKYAQALAALEEKNQLYDLSLVYTDPMSDSDIVIGEVLYSYAEELDDHKVGIAVKLLPNDLFTLESKLRVIADKLGIAPHINNYALTESS